MKLLLLVEEITETAIGHRDDYECGKVALV
jgi:hypothetical protein